ncbi:MAG: TspO/MBR family protein [bacterium]
MNAYPFNDLKRLKTSVLKHYGTIAVMQRSIADWGGNMAAFGIVLVANTLANAVPLGGQTTGEISDRYPSLFTPAGYVFSIWGLIYLALIFFVVWQALPAQRNSVLLQRMRLPFQISCLCNAAWIFAWHYDQLVLSLVIMLVLLWTLVTIYRRVNLHHQPQARGERFCLYLPFSLYTAWISVALIANASAIQLAYGWEGAVVSPVTWTVLKLAAAGTVAVGVLFRFRDSAWMLVVVWASLGIAFKHADTAIVYGAALLLGLLGLGLIALQLSGLARDRYGSF